MKNLARLGSRILTAVLLLSAAAMSADPPSRVARLQYMSGEVSLQPSGVNDWVAGVANRPLTTADRLWTDKNSRAELHLGSAIMRVDAETSLTLTNLTDDSLQVELDQGTLNLRVRRLYHGEIYEVDTPNVAFTIMKAGEYRFDVDPNGDTTLVTVWHGQGAATGEGRAVKVKGNRQARFTGGPSLAHQIYHAPDEDGFDDWCRVRDKRQDYSQSARYVSPEIIGAEDLDDYGTWRVVPTYGAVWVPTVAAGWAPYHYGHWAWVEPWGWTWIDDAPWGFAPSHYGRWAYYNGYWAWVPGPVAVRPVYAPALVAWVGGSNFGVSLTIGGGLAVGWFPLGYGEPYLPPYAGSRNYFRNVNVSNTRITNITNVTNNYYNTTNINSNNTTITKNNTTIVTNNNTSITNNTTTNNTDNSVNIHGDHNNVHIKYANQKVPGAVTAVPSTVLANSQPVANTAVQVPASELKETSIAAAPAVAPSKTSVLGTGAGATTSVPPARAVSRQVIMRVAAPPKPIPFSAKQEALASNPGRPLDRDTEDQLRTKIARQPSNPANDLVVKHPDDPKIAKPQPVIASPEKSAEVPQPVPGTLAPGTTASGTVVNAVPQTSVKPDVRKAAAPPSAERKVPQPPGGRPVRNVDTPQAQGHAVPRPPERPSTPVSAEKAVSQPRAETPEVNTGRPSAQDHAVPRPQRGNTPQPRYEPVVGSPQTKPQLVPQPPANDAASGHEAPRTEPRTAEPSRPESHPSPPREQSKPDRGRPTGNSARPTAEPATGHPTPKAESAPSGGREVRPAVSNTPPPSHKEEPKNTPPTDAPH